MAYHDDGIDAKNGPHQAVYLHCEQCKELSTGESDVDNLYTLIRDCAIKACPLHPWRNESKFDALGPDDNQQKPIYNKCLACQARVIGSSDQDRLAIAVEFCKNRSCNLFDWRNSKDADLRTREQKAYQYSKKNKPSEFGKPPSWRHSKSEGKS